MLRQLVDPANAITGIGLVLSVIGISFVLAGQLEIGVAIALWALLADHLDGVVAKRTIGRASETGEVGKNLDSLADLVSAGIFPAVTLIAVGQGSLLSIAAAATLSLASALRLSYFNVFGSPGGRFIGVPTTYALPVTAVMFLARPFIPAVAFPELLAFVVLAIAALHVTPVRIPKTAGAMYLVVTVFCVAASLALAFGPWRVGQTPWLRAGQAENLASQPPTDLVMNVPGR
ncbi:CDP-alcohol phosphatidyltransferase family protein [Mesorhizobium retamae]|uniref:CDP-alcohol phosphatidyltransferase family protein n=1 Tax=Mesorhizobium retamae TaxID=2912854 RepID=A0ABS9QM24_9HYPH|nr:CDP-alcohol phosphatidyltransferase family protein [Mesorhizobium sp. IRAMC:0171]MCG7508501.1 CDP-alcohol phosphatidyltransferase family protein [Mesorhizobium sp. IRAMC:0171]